MERNAKYRLIYSVFLGVFTVIVGILFLAEAADLYYSGVAETGAAQGMYSREVVGARLLELLAPILLWIVAIVLGAAVYAAFPITPKRRSPRDYAQEYLRVRKRVSKERNPAAYAYVRRLEYVRLAARILCAAFCLVSAGVCVGYLADPQNFTSLSALGSEIPKMIATIAPCVGLALLALAGEAAFENAFAKAMLPRVRPLVGRGAFAQGGSAGSAVSRYAVPAARIALFAVAAVFLGLGIANGGAASVLIKAINICTECIGLG